MYYDDEEEEDFLENFNPRTDFINNKTFPGENYPALIEFEKFKPIFGYDYISLCQSEWCFDHPQILTSDFIKIISKKKEISSKSYKDLHDAKGTRYRFHRVDLEHRDRRHLKTKLANLMNISGNDDFFPEIFQFEVYTDTQIGKAPRILGFVGKLGVFYLLWYDQFHQAYSSSPTKNT